MPATSAKRATRAVSTSPAPFHRPQPLRHQIGATLLSDIITGVYRPGQRVVERDLVKRFGVSAIPIREALQDLENQGLLVKRANAGCSVISLSAAETVSICEFRRLLEPQVVAWAAERVTSEGSSILRSKFALLREAAAAGDIPRFFLADLEFHKAIWDVSGNRWAARALSTAMGSLFASGFIAANESGGINLRTEVSRHERMLNAVIKGNAAEAAACLSAIAGSFQERLAVSFQTAGK